MQRLGGRKLVASALLTGILMVSGSAPLKSWASARNGVWGITGAFDYATESMSDVNNLLSSGSFNSINSGLGGGSLTYGFANNWQLGINVDYIYSSSDTFNVSSSGNDFHFRFPLLETAITGSYILPDVWTNTDLKATLGLAYEGLNGSTASNAPGFSSANLTASGFGAFLTVGAEYFFVPHRSFPWARISATAWCALARWQFPRAETCKPPAAAMPWRTSAAWI